MSDQSRGIFNKYKIEGLPDGEPRVVFVLDLDHDPFAEAARLAWRSFWFDTIQGEALYEAALALNQATYTETRQDGRSAPGAEHHGCSYLVLDLLVDAKALNALLAYADDCEVAYPRLAVDLRDIALHSTNPSDRALELMKGQ